MRTRRSLGASLSSQQIQQQITAAATAAGIPPSLALAVAQIESGFDPNAVSPTNSNGTKDYGLFQINSSNFSSLGLTNPLDPTQNINAGVGLLSQLYNQYGGDLTQVLWAYNAGPGSVSSGNMPTSTQSYIPEVLVAQANYGSSAPADLLGLDTTSSDVADTTGISAAGFLTSDVSVAGVQVPAYALGLGVGLLFLAVWFAFD